MHGRKSQTKRGAGGGGGRSARSRSGSTNPPLPLPLEQLGMLIRAAKSGDLAAEFALWGVLGVEPLDAYCVGGGAAAGGGGKAGPSCGTVVRDARAGFPPVDLVETVRVSFRWSPETAPTLSALLSCLGCDEGSQASEADPAGGRDPTPYREGPDGGGSLDSLETTNCLESKMRGSA